MKRINIHGMKIHQIVERGNLPHNIKWNGNLPPSYFISLLVDEKNKDKSIIICADGFGGGIAWATLDFIPKLIGGELEVNKDEMDYLKSKYPILYEAINNF